MLETKMVIRPTIVFPLIKLYNNNELMIVTFGPQLEFSLALTLQGQGAELLSHL